MGAFEETKCRRSVVSDTFQFLTEQAKRCHEKIDLLEAGQILDHDQAIAELERLLDTCQNLRDAILSEDNGATWSSTSELRALVERLDETAEKRRRCLNLAQLLGSGTVTHRRERTKQERLRQRDAAIQELMEISALPSPPDLPGPAVEEWLNWACHLDDSANEPDLAKLQASFPRVDDFVRQLELETWHSESAPNSDHVADAVHEVDVVHEVGDAPMDVPEMLLAEAAPPAMEAEQSQDSADETDLTDTLPAEIPGTSVQASELTVSEALIEQHEIPAMETDQMLELADPVLEPTEAAPSEAIEIAPEGTEEIPRFIDPPKPTWADLLNLKHLVSRGLSFFDEEELEYFRRYLDEAKSEAKTARSVRSLLAISHWLQPLDQNPVLHSTYGIRAQVGYTNAMDPDPVSPQDAARVIEADGGLLLLAGGADLLRWSIAQRAEGHFDAIAAVRRLTMEQIKGWFGDVFKIELAEPQILDVYKMTSGIPLLMGELHRLVLPNPKTPPTWLGFQIWTSVKSGFENRLPSLSRELRTGPPAVRLTEQEIRVLKMLVIASDDSTPETIASNLREDWEKYKRPELQALSVKDEPRVRLLQSLGLLPMRHGERLGPMQAILPLDGEDALRQIVTYL